MKHAFWKFKQDRKLTTQIKNGINNSWTTIKIKQFTVWKVIKYGVFSAPYFPIFSPNTGKYGQEKTPYLDTFHAVIVTLNVMYLSGYSICDI